MTNHPGLQGHGIRLDFHQQRQPSMDARVLIIYLALMRLSTTLDQLSCSQKQANDKYSNPKHYTHHSRYRLPIPCAELNVA